MAEVPTVENRMNALSKRLFGTSQLMKETEFHGIDICRGKGNFKGRPLSERLEILQEILAILTSEAITRLYVRIIPENITHSPKPPDEIAFMYFVEKANELFRAKATVGMLFGDYDEPVIGASVASLSRFRDGGTLWDRGREIAHIVDTVHFAKSHHSRMIQLADIYLYVLQFSTQPASSPWRRSVADVIERSQVRFGARSKVWPTDRTWYR